MKLWGVRWTYRPSAPTSKGRHGAKTNDYGKHDRHKNTSEAAVACTYGFGVARDSINDVPCLPWPFSDALQGGIRPGWTGQYSFC